MIDIAAEIAGVEAARGASNGPACRFFDPTWKGGRYVLGRNPDALQCTKIVPVDGIVDDYAEAGTRWNGLPVVRADCLPEGSLVVNCSTSIRPLSAHARLESVRGIEVVAYADLVGQNALLPNPAFVESSRKDFIENPEKWRYLCSRLADAESTSVFDHLVLYRLSGDYRHMASFSVRFQDQYFDPVVRPSASEVFVDCGGFDGDTVLEFCSRNPKFRRIYVFEPSEANFAKACTRLRGIADVIILPLGVSDKNGSLSFNTGAGSASSVSQEGNVRIEVVTLDDYITEEVSFIKMDLEGWELNALKGSRRHIVEDHPKLAISVYHEPSHFWRVPEYVLGLRDDYDIYLRHYSEGWSETVMYFIPRRD